MAPLASSQTATGSRCSGSGCGRSRMGRECVNAVRWALELGLSAPRHGPGVRERTQRRRGGCRESGGVPARRGVHHDQVPPRQKDPARRPSESLERLGIDRLDLYIVHWPQGGPTWAWPGMERARELGHARSIGVSNFNANELGQLLNEATVAPVVQPGAVQPVQRTARPAGRVRAGRRSARGLQPAGTRQLPRKRDG